MSLVGAEKIERSVAVGEHDNGGIGKADVQVGVAFHDAPGVTHVLIRKRLQSIGSTRDFVHERQLGLMTDAAAYQIIQLGQNERREEPRRRRCGKGSDGATV